MMKGERKRGASLKDLPPNPKTMERKLYQNFRSEGSMKVKLYLSPDTVFQCAKTSKRNWKKIRGRQNMLVQTKITYGGENKQTK